jgi:hypothetical protein
MTIERGDISNTALILNYFCSNAFCIYAPIDCLDILLVNGKTVLCHDRKSFSITCFYEGLKAYFFASCGRFFAIPKYTNYSFAHSKSLNIGVC